MVLLYMSEDKLGYKTIQLCKGTKGKIRLDKMAQAITNKRYCACETQCKKIRGLQKQD